MRPCRCSPPDSLHPADRGPRRFAFFYSKISADGTLENGHLQVAYGAEIPLMGTNEVAGARMVLGLNGHCLVVDFPPFPGVRFNLSQSCSAELWPMRRPAGARRRPSRHLRGPIKCCLLYVRGSLSKSIRHPCAPSRLASTFAKISRRSRFTRQPRRRRGCLAGGEGDYTWLCGRKVEILAKRYTSARAWPTGKREVHEGAD